MAAILFIHNRSILASKNITVHPPYNYQHKVECSLNDNCHKRAIIYKASISIDGNDPFKCYYGCCKTEFKSCFYNNRQTFKNKQKIYTTELSKVSCEAIDNGKDPRIEWSISVNYNTYQPGSTRFDLCLDEKLVILLADRSSILNKRTELTGKCCHKNKFKLKTKLKI